MLSLTSGNERVGRKPVPSLNLQSATFHLQSLVLRTWMCSFRDKFTGMRPKKRIGRGPGQTVSIRDLDSRVLVLSRRYDLMFRCGVKSGLKPRRLVFPAMSVLYIIIMNIKGQEPLNYLIQTEICCSAVITLIGSDYAG